MTKLSSFLFLFFLGSSLLAQKNVFVNINPVFNEDPLQIGVELQHNNGEIYALDHFDYYVSDVLLTHDGGQLTTVQQAVYLVEPDNHVLYLGLVNVENIENIEFTVGVPNRFNTQQGIEAADISTYPETHPLSFQLPSMYWGWSFGYMPMIIGGSEGASYFELHSVGPTLQRQVVLAVIQTDVSASQINLELQCHVDRWVNGIELLTAGAAHGAFPSNITAMDNILTESVFTVSPMAGLIEFSSTSTIFFSEGQLNYINIPARVKEICVYDQLGRILLSEPVYNQDSFAFDFSDKGLVFVLCRDAFGSILEKKTIFIP
jgi:hypothetical protein